MDDLELVIILSAVATLLLFYFVAREFQRIAAMKGHEEKRYFWWSFLLGPVGQLMVVALPDRGEQKKNATQPDDSLPDL